jgi:hypothetical protein
VHSSGPTVRRRATLDHEKRTVTQQTVLPSRACGECSGPSQADRRRPPAPGTSAVEQLRGWCAASGGSGKSRPVSKACCHPEPARDLAFPNDAPPPNDGQARSLGFARDDSPGVAAAFGLNELAGAMVSQRLVAQCAVPLVAGSAQRCARKLSRALLPTVSAA